jgi:hypothetical protein
MLVIDSLFDIFHSLVTDFRYCQHAVSVGVSAFAGVCAPMRNCSCVYDDILGSGRSSRYKGRATRWQVGERSVLGRCFGRGIESRNQIEVLDSSDWRPVLADCTVMRGCLGSGVGHVHFASYTSASSTPWSATNFDTSLISERENSTGGGTSTRIK